MGRKKATEQATEPENLSGTEYPADQPAAAREQAKPEETKAQRFRRLVMRRMPNALKTLKYVRNLATASYEFTPEQAAKVVADLTAAVKQVKDAFDGASEPASDWSID